MRSFLITLSFQNGFEIRPMMSESFPKHADFGDDNFLLSHKLIDKINQRPDIVSIVEISTNDLKSFNGHS